MPPPTTLHHEPRTFAASDGLTLFEQRWAPETSPQASEAHATVLIVHGLAEHSGRYEHIATRLVEGGYAVHTYDHRGHGRSGGPRAQIHRFSDYLDDLAIAVARARGALPGRPLYLFGHSMGGAISVLYCIERGDEVDGLLLSSPAVFIGTDVPAIVQWLIRVVSRVLPALPTIRIDPADLSRDPAVVARHQQDPLVYHRPLPARTIVELADACAAIRQNLDAITCPLLVFHGTEDRLTDPHGSRYLYAHAASDDKTLALFDGLYHETFNEPEAEQVLREILDWLDEHAR